MVAQNVRSPPSNCAVTALPPWATEMHERSNVKRPWVARTTVATCGKTSKITGTLES